MKIIQHTTTNLVVKDSAGCLWLFGLFFVVVAGTFVIGLMGVFNNLNELSLAEQILAWIISLSGVAAGIGVIYSNPSIRSDFDKRESIVTIKRKSLMKSETERYPIADIKDVIIKESRDDDNDPIYSVEMIIANAKNVSLTKTWLRNKEELDMNVKQIKDFLK